MSKKKSRAHARPPAAAAESESEQLARAQRNHNEPGDVGHQPTGTEQAEGVNVSSAVPETVDLAEFDSLKKKVEQLCIKVGI